MDSTKTPEGYLGNCYVKSDEVANTKLKPIHASMQDLKNGGWFTSGNHGLPGIISNLKMSKTGKHGHAKFTFLVAYPFTGQNSQEMHPGHTHLLKPECFKMEMLVTDYEPDTGHVEAMDEANETTIFICIPTLRDLLEKA